MTKYKFVSLTNPNWNAHTHELMQKLKLVKHKWPDEGVPPTMVDGIKLWVNPRAPKADRALGIKKSSTHRVMCECPGCGDVLSAGRLFQHKCVKKQRASRAKPRGK